LLPVKNRNLLSLGLAAWFLGAPLAFSAAALSYLLQVGAEGLPALPLLALCTIGLLGFALLPTTFVALAAGYIGGMGSLAFTLATYLPAAALGYWVGQWARPMALLAWLEMRPGFTATMQRLAAGGWQTVAWVRLSPVVPFGIGNLAMAWAGIPLRSVLIGSLPGMLPRTLLATYLGYQAHSLQQAFKGGASPAQLWLSALFFAIAALGLYLQGRAIQPKTPSDVTAPPLP
jgi:uncharacterized membrane protein YdjX (TVP38/TMEM64 family)